MSEDTRTPEEIRAEIGEQYNLPAELVDRLGGDTAEEMEADARTLARYLPAPGGEDRPLFGGLDPYGPPSISSDPRALARLAPRR